MTLAREANQFEPVTVEARYEPPKREVDPDTHKGWFKRLSPIVFTQRFTIAASLLSALVMIGLQVAIPAVTMQAVDNALVQRDEPLRNYVLLLLALAALRFVFGFVYRFGLQRVSLAIEYDLRNLIYTHLTRLSFSFFDRVQTGQLISRANSDIRAIQMFLGFAPSVAITFVMFFAAFGLMLRIHIGLALVAVITLPLVYFTGLNMRSKMFPISWVVQARTADLATIVEENVTGVRVVKSFAAEPQQISLLERAAQRLLWAANKQVDIRAQFSPLMQNFPRVGLAMVLLYGGHLVINGEVTVGALLAFNSYVLMLQAPFMMLGFLMMMAQRAAASAGRIFEILDEKPAIDEHPGAVDLLSPMGDVEFRGVRFGYASGPDILTDFNLHLWPGETVAMVGRTGCGKSTAARLIPRFYDVRDGAVMIDGTDVRQFTLASLRSNIGLVLDEPFLFSESIRDNITYGRPGATFEEIEAAAIAAGADGFVRALPQGYDTVIGERGYTLSGGQRQRIAIARTLLVNPPILILDDATSSVDVQREQEIHGALKTLMKGRTTLIIAHRLSTISLADRVVLLEGGRIIADGTHAELMREVPQYAEILAHGEEEWVAAHTPPDPEKLEEMMPTRMRAMKHLAEARASRAEEGGAPMGDGMPGGPMPGGAV